MNREKLTRRRMMLNSASLAAGLSLTTLARAAKNQSQNKTKKPKGFLIGACDWNLGKMSDPGSFAVARQIGLDGVQVSLGTAKNDMHLRKPEVQKAFLQAARKNKVKIASLAIGELNNVPYKSEPQTEQWVSDCVDVCKAMKVKVVLLAFFGKGDLRNDPKGVDAVVKRLKKVAPKARDKGVILGIETWLSAEDSMAIIKRVGSPAVQVYYDVGNSHVRGYDIYKEIPYLGRHICEFHAKDYNNLFGKGKIDFPKVRKAMDKIGYRGWFQIEGATPLGMIESYKQDAQYLRSIFPPKV
jgi:sugar phosphate isomerase/epimerase